MSRIMVTGSDGQLGRDLSRCVVDQGHELVAVGHGGPPGLELTRRPSIEAAILGSRPDLVIHAAGWTAVDACEGDPDRADAVNGTGTLWISEAAQRARAHVVYVSSDYVFDGTATRPYQESDSPCPLQAYGRSKLKGETSLGQGHTVVRTSWLAGHHGSNVIKHVLSHPGQDLAFVDDQRGNPTFSFDLAPALIELGLERASGTFHVTNGTTMSWFELVRDVLVRAGRDPGKARPISTAELTPKRAALRPAYSALANIRGEALGLSPLASFDQSLARLVKDLTI